MKASKSPTKQPRHRRFLRWLAGAFASLVGIVIAVGLVLLMLPRSWNPVVPLNPRDAIGPLTRWKLQGLAIDGQACRRFLTQAGVGFTNIPDRSEQGFCNMDDAIKMTTGGPPLFPEGPIMSCPVAAGLIIWERQALQPSAQAMLGSPVTRINHLGTFACRRQYGRKTGWISEHASANALDVQGFVLADGRTITVLDSWNPRGGMPTQAANFLRDVHDRACDVFKVTLGPDANAAHANHFHIDMGPMLSCR